MTTVMPKALGALLKLFFLAGVPSSPPDELRRGVHALKMSWQEWNGKLVVRHTDAPVARVAVRAALDWFTTTQPPLAYPSSVAVRSGEVLARKLSKSKPARPKKPPPVYLGRCTGHICGNPATERCDECGALVCWIHGKRTQERPAGSTCEGCIARLGWRKL